MPNDPTPPPFPTTRWSLVARAADRTGGGAEALEDLLLQYAAPMRRYLTVRWHARPEVVDDLLQAFVADKILQQEILTKADARRGRFRGFLMSVLNNFAANYFRDERRVKRGSGEIVTLGNLDPTADDGDPAAAFDVEWARQVVQRAVARMRGECERSGRADLWGVFEARILGPTLHHQPPVPYGELVQRFGLASPEQASNVLMTAKRTFARCLRGVISEYEDDPAEVEAEMADLQTILARA